MLRPRISCEIGRWRSRSRSRVAGFARPIPRTKKPGTRKIRLPSQIAAIRTKIRRLRDLRVYLRFTGSPFILRFVPSYPQTVELIAYSGSSVTANNMLSARLPEADQSVSIETLLGVAAQATDILNQIRDAMLEPYPRKAAPTFTSAQVASLCGLDKQRFQYLTTKGDLPTGTSKGAGRSKEFSLEETLTWVGATTERPRPPAEKRGRIVTV